MDYEEVQSLRELTVPNISDYSVNFRYCLPKYLNAIPRVNKVKLYKILRFLEKKLTGGKITLHIFHSSTTVKISEDAIERINGLGTILIRNFSI